MDEEKPEQPSIFRGGVGPSGGSEAKPSYLKVFERFMEDWNTGKTLKIKRHVPELLAERPTGDDADYRIILHDVFHILSTLDRADPANASSELSDILDVLKEKIDVWSSSAINTWVFSILVPAGRAAEAVSALRPVIEDYHYSGELDSSATHRMKSAFTEDVNSLSNLGVVFAQLGLSIKAEAVFSAIRASEFPGLATEANYWMAHISQARGHDDETEAWLLLSKIAAQVSKDSSYLQKSQNCLNGTCHEKPLVLQSTEVNSTFFYHSKGSEWEGIPSIEQSSSFLRGYYPWLTDLNVSSESVPELGPVTPRDWANLLFRDPDGATSDWSLNDPELLDAGMLLARSVGLNTEPSGLWTARYLCRHGGPTANDLRHLYLLLVDASMCVRCTDDNYHSDARAALALGVVMHSALEGNSSGAARAFLSSVSALVLNSLVRAQWTNHIEPWLREHPGLPDDDEWLLAKSAGLAQVGQIDEAFRVLDAVSRDDAYVSALRLSQSMVEGKSWPEISSEVSRLREAVSAIVSVSHAGEDALLWRLAISDNPCESSSPLEAAALALWYFHLGDGTNAIRRWVSVSKALAGLENARVLKRELVAQNRPDLPRIIEVDTPFRVGAALAHVFLSYEVDVALAMSQLKNTHFEPQSEAWETFLTTMANAEGWSFDLRRMLRLLERDADIEILEEFCEHGDPRVLEYILTSDAVTDDIARRVLGSAPEPERSSLAALAVLAPRISLPAAREFSELVEESELWEVASNPNASSSLLVEWSRHPSEAVRRAVARNSAASEDILAELALDSALAVRDAVESNPNSTDEIRALVALQG